MEGGRSSKGAEEHHPPGPSTCHLHHHGSAAAAGQGQKQGQGNGGAGHRHQGRGIVKGEGGAGLRGYCHPKVLASCGHRPPALQAPRLCHSGSEAAERSVRGAAAAGQDPSVHEHHRQAPPACRLHHHGSAAAEPRKRATAAAAAGRDPSLVVTVFQTPQNAQIIIQLTQFMAGMERMLHSHRKSQQTL